MATRFIQRMVGGRGRVGNLQLSTAIQRGTVICAATRGRKPKVDVSVEDAVTPIPEAAPIVEPEAAAPKKRGRKPKSTEAASPVEEDLSTVPPPAAKKTRAPRKPKQQAEAVLSSSEVSSDKPEPERSSAALLGIETPWATSASPADQQAELHEYAASRGADTTERRQRKKKAAASVTPVIKQVTSELEEKVVKRDENG